MKIEHSTEEYFRLEIIRLLDQRPQVRNGLPPVLFADLDFGQVYLASRIRSCSLLRVAACNACS